MAERPEELRVVDEILASIESRVTNIKNTERDMGFLGDQIRRAAEEARGLFDVGPLGRFGRVIREVTESVKRYTEQIKEASVVQVGLTGAVAGFLTGFSGAKSILTGFGALLKTTFTIGTSVIGAFAKSIGAVFSFFYGALKSGGGGTGLYEELQEIRKQFGGLEDFTSQAIFAVADNLRELPRRLAAVGWHLRDIIKNAREYAETLGPLFMQFVREEFTPATVLFLKGMGASEEASVSIVQSARAMGQSLNETLEGVARSGAAVAAAIGESRKVIQREMLEARRDVATFGSVADEELAVVIGRFRSLGLEAEAAAGLVANFDTFEDAADAVSQLSVAFGVQLDTFRLVNEENPANRLDYLRQQLFRAGRSAEQMSRRELMVLGETLGETDLNMVRLALSAENAGMSMEDIRTAAEESGEQTKSMEEVLSDLANAMERMVMSGAGYNTFLEAMNYGIERGIRYFLWQTGVMFAYRRALHETAWGFRELTMSFLENFPGIRDVVMGLRDLFDPGRFRQMFDDIEDAIEDFLTEDNFDVRSFFGALYDALYTFFDPTGEAMSQIISGGRQILSSLAEVTKVGLEMFTEFVFGDPQGGIARRLLDGFEQALEFLVLFLTPGNVEEKLAEARGFAGGFFGGIIEPIIEFFQSPEVQETMGNIMGLLGEALWQGVLNLNNLFKKIGGFIFERIGADFLVDAEGKGPGLAQTIGAVILGPTVMGALSGVLLQAGLNLGSALLSGIGKFVTKNVSGILTGSFGAGISTFAKSATIVGAIGSLGQSYGDALDNLNEQLEGEFEQTDMKVGALIAGIVDTITLGLLPENWINDVAMFGINLSEQFFQAIENIAGPNFVEPLREVYSEVLDLLEPIGDIFSGLIDIVKGLFTLDSEAFADGIRSVFAGLIDLPRQAFDAMYNFFTNLPQMLFSAAGLFSEFALDVGASLLEGIWPAGGDMLRQAGDWLRSLMEGLSGALGVIGDFFEDVRDFFVGGMQWAWNGLLELLGIRSPSRKAIELMQNILAGFRIGLEGLGDILTDFLEGPIRRAFNSVADIFRGFVNTVKEILGVNNPPNVFEQIAQGVVEGLQSGLEFAGGIRQVFLDAFALISPINLMADLLDSFGLSPSKIIETIQESVTALIEGAGDVASAASQAFGGIMDTINPFSRGGDSTTLRRVSTEPSGDLSVNNLILIAEQFSGISSSRITEAVNVLSIIEDNNLIENFGNTYNNLVRWLVRLEGLGFDQNSGIRTIVGMSLVLSSLFDNLPDASEVNDSISILNSIESSGLFELTQNFFSRLAMASSAIDSMISSSRLNANAIVSSIETFGRMTHAFEDSGLSTSEISSISMAIGSVNQTLMPELTTFFDKYAELNTAITRSGIIDLPEVTIDKIATLLPAAAAATETLGAEITTDSIRVAMAGNTFNISVVMEVDGRELGRVAAENLTTQ